MKVSKDFPHQVETIENSWIPMADDVKLSARIWLPEGAESSPVPTILEYIPYRHRDMTRERDAIHAAYLAGYGYAFVRVDIRGCGNSQGYILDQYSEDELNDGVAVINWLARQPWCDGNVGMMGISWGGFNALQIAALQPEPLKAIITVCSTDDTYIDNMHFMGGCLLGDNLSEATTMFAYQSCPPDPEIVGEAWRDMWQQRLEKCYPWLEPWLENSVRDDYWKRTSVCEDYSAIQCPVMAVSGWADGFSNAVFRLVDHLDVPCTGLIGPWSHKYPHLGVPGPSIGFLQEARRWFGHWLAGEDNEVEKDPKLRVWMQESMPPQYATYEERPGHWAAEAEWPSPNIQDKRLPFGEFGLMLDGDAEDGSRGLEPCEPRAILSPLVVGLHAGKWCSYAAAPDHPGDQREEDGGSMVFESEQLEEQVEVVGSPVVKLRVSADKPVAQVAVRLSDVRPNGEATRVTYGLLNLTHRNGHEHPEPLTPDEPVDVEVDLNGIAQQFPAGHRIRIAISTSYWPMAWPAPEPATVTVYPQHSALILPVRNPQPEDGHNPFEPSEGAAPAPVRYVQAPDQNWRVLRDLARDTATLEVVRHNSEALVEDVGIYLKKRTLETYSSTASEYDSVRGETRTERRFVRGDWAVKVNTRTVLTTAKDSLRLHATLDAYEGDERVFSRTWTKRIERKLF